jgi:hypothetical protein
MTHPILPCELDYASTPTKVNARHIPDDLIDAELETLVVKLHQAQKKVFDPIALPRITQERLRELRSLQKEAQYFCDATSRSSPSNPHYS